jgi:cytochrome c5
MKLIAACVTSMGAFAAGAANHVDRSGKEVVDNVCAACHASGVNGAPKIGDAKAWDARSRRGLTALTATALEGVRKMPPHGRKPEPLRPGAEARHHAHGQPERRQLDRAHRPAPPAAPAHRPSRSCVRSASKCHGPGLNGAPKIGDKAAWIDRAKLGFDSAVRSAINGHGAMPARGGMPSLTDAEMRAAGRLHVLPERFQGRPGHEMKILIAADGSEFSRAAARYVASQAGLLKERPQVRIVHVHARLPVTKSISRKAIQEYYRDESLKALAVAEKELDKAKVDYTSSWCAGDAAEEIARLAGKKRSISS